MVYIPASAAVTGIPLIRVITVVKMPVHVPKKHPAEISDPKTAWNEVIGCDILPQRPVIPRKNILISYNRFMAVNTLHDRQQMAVY